MLVNFYKNLSDENVVNKVLNDELQVNVVMHNDADFIKPELEVNAQIADYNYFYIPIFHRYYFIDDIGYKRNNLLVVTGKIDVLQTYRADILNSHGLITENVNANKYSGQGFESEVRKTQRIFQFENNFNESGQMVLITIAGNNIS